MPNEIVALKRVSAYRTSDGKLHDTRPEAQKAQARLDLAAWVAAAPAFSECDHSEAVSAMVDAGPALLDTLKAATKTAKGAPQTES